MKKTLLALTLLAASASAFAQTAPVAKKASGARADGCAGMAAAKCDKSMASAPMSMADMPACCRAKMAARAAATTTASAAKPVVKAL